MELTKEQQKQMEQLRIEDNRNIVSGYLAIITATVPLVIWPFIPQRFFESKMIMLYAFALILLCFLAALKLNILSKKLFKEPAVISILFFFAYTTATLFSTINMDLSLGGVHERKETYFVIAIYVLFFLTAANNYRFKNWHVTLFAVMIGIICIYAIFQLYGIELIDLTPIAKYKISQSWHYMAFSTLGNPNFLASMLAMALPIFVFAFIKSGNYLWSIPMSLNFFVLLGTRTRGAWIAAFIAFVVLVTIMAVKKYSIKNIIMCCVIHVGVTLLYAFLFAGFFERLWSTIDAMATIVASDNEQQVMESGSFRIGIWKGVWMLIKKRPFTGYGIETLREAIIYDPEVSEFLRNISRQLPNSNKAHNEFLNIAVSSGIPAGVAYLTTAIASIAKGFMNLKKNPIILPITCAVTAYFIQGMFNISNNGIAFIFYILMGVIISLCMKEDTKQLNNLEKEKI